MEIESIQVRRRERLKAWVGKHGGQAAIAERFKLTTSQGSYLSQVLNGYSIGERAARSWESRLKMREGYLDEDESAGGSTTASALGDMLDELARAIAAQPRTKRLQLQTLLADLAATPDARAETCEGIMELLEPAVPYKYTKTWEEAAREGASVLGDALITAADFVAKVDEYQGKNVSLTEVRRPKSSP